MPACPNCGAPVSRKNTFALLGLIFGIIGAALCWIPYLGFLLAAAGLVFSIIGVTRKNAAGKGKAIAGIILAGIGLIIASFVTSALSKSDGTTKNTQPAVTSAVVAASESDQESNIVATAAETTEEPTTIATTAGIDKDAFIESCSELNYKDIARNPDNYVGQNFYYMCYISSARTSGLLSGYQRYFITYAFDMDKAEERIESGWYEDLAEAKDYCKDYDVCVWLLDNRNESDPDYIKILEGDVIMVYGTFNGLTGSKNSLTGETSDEVSLDIKYVEIVAE